MAEHPQSNIETKFPWAICFMVINIQISVCLRRYSVKKKKKENTKELIVK